MEEKEFSILSGIFRDDRVDGEDRKMFPRHEDVPRTVYLDGYNLIIDKADNVQGKDLPSIGQMLRELLP